MQEFSRCPSCGCAVDFKLHGHHSAADCSILKYAERKVATARAEALKDAESKYMADAERLAEVVKQVSNWQIQKYAGARYECLFCGKINQEHSQGCISLEARAALAAHERGEG